MLVLAITWTARFACWRRTSAAISGRSNEYSRRWMAHNCATREKSPRGMCDQVRSTSCDVTVIGGGLAGKAASLHLARAGLKVVCLEPRQAVRPPVGESLDWSAPDLLNRLGISPESLLESRIATWKRHVILKMRDGCDVHYVP